MAIPSLTPYVAPDDMISLEDCSDLLRQTGHSRSLTTLRRWIAEHPDMCSERRRGGKIYVSFSDILVVHRDEVRRRD
ncbi:hypothetical protein [Streptomyces sp. Wb2n-11]|uniref:hypothetical protein n=1 Tax=Streptomyces sp. Wb2n-11 TaxID=1030533 RepID=UPI000AE0F43F|nr:hypothetical protein [Streptomyces sp. Wb2n-11]